MINSCKNCCGYYLGNFWSYLGNFLNSASGHTVRPLQLSLSFSLFQCTKCTDPFCLSFSNVVVQILHFPPHTVHMVSAVVVGHNSLFLVHKIVRSGRRRRRRDWIVRAGRDCENWTSVHPPSRHVTSRRRSLLHISTLHMATFKIFPIRLTNFMLTIEQNITETLLSLFKFIAIPNG